MQLKTILNRVQKFNSSVYGKTHRLNIRVGVKCRVII